MTNPPAADPAFIISAYLDGESTLDYAIMDYGLAKNLTDQNTIIASNAIIASFAKDVLERQISDPKQFGKLAELEKKIYKISPSSAYKIYEMSIKLLLGGDSAAMNEVNNSACFRGILGEHPLWDKMCFKFNEFINHYITRERFPNFTAMLDTANSLINQYIRKERKETKEEIDPKTEKQHIVLQYLNLLSEEDRQNPTKIKDCFILVHQQDARLFLEELDKMPEKLRPVNSGNGDEFLNYLKCVKLLQQADGDTDQKHCILLAAQLLPRFSSAGDIKEAASHLKSFQSDDRAAIIKTIKAFTRENLSLKNILSTKIAPIKAREVVVINEKNASQGGGLLSPIIKSVVNLGTSALRNSAVLVGWRSGTLSTTEQAVDKAANTSIIQESVSGSSSPQSQAVSPRNIGAQQTKPPKELMQGYFDEFDQAVLGTSSKETESSGVAGGFGDFIKSLPALGSDTKVELSNDKNTLKITLPQQMTPRLVLKKDTKLTSEQYQQLNRVDITKYQQVRTDYVVNEKAKRTFDSNKSYSTDNLEYFGTVGDTSTAILKKGMSIQVGPELVFTKVGNMLKIQGLKMPNPISSWLPDIAINEVILKRGPNGEPYIEIALFGSSGPTERYFLEDLKTLMQLLYPTS